MQFWQISLPYLKQGGQSSDPQTVLTVIKHWHCFCHWFFLELIFQQNPCPQNFTIGVMLYCIPISISGYLDLL